MAITYSFPMYVRLRPIGPWRGGRISDTDVLTLSEAAREASAHAGVEVTISDFLRAAARGEITLRAIVHRSAKVQKHDGGIYCNEGEPTENTVPKWSIQTLPVVACRQLANIGRASWRTFEGVESIFGQWCRFDIAWLAEGEPDFETTQDDCRVIGFDVHALADAFAANEAEAAPSAAPATQTEVTPAPTETATGGNARIRNDDIQAANDDVRTHNQPDHDAELAGLFDLVRKEQLETMFPDGGNWASYAERADRNGLAAAREGRGIFNPYRAALWWLERYAPAGWTWARCARVLANNLPPRSRDSRHLLTGDFE